MSDRKVPARWQGTPAEPYWMNPGACARLVAEHGSQAKAGRAIGVGRSNIQQWLDPDRDRASQKSRYAKLGEGGMCVKSCGRPAADNRTRCKECLEWDREKSRRFRKENHEKVKASLNRYYERNREYLLGRAREYQEENREKIQRRRRRYYEENREKMIWAGYRNRLRNRIQSKRSSIQRLKQELANA